MAARIDSVRGVHRPKGVVISSLFDVIQRFVHGCQGKIARRYVARVDDAALQRVLVLTVNRRLSDTPGPRKKLGSVFLEWPAGRETSG